MATATAKKLKIRPLEDRVVVQPFEAEERTRGGIVLPDTAREKPQQGKVIATGPSVAFTVRASLRTPTSISSRTLSEYISCLAGISIPRLRVA